MLACLACVSQAWSYDASQGALIIDKGAEGFPLSLLLSTLSAFTPEVFLRVADAALHHLSIPSFWVALVAEVAVVASGCRAARPEGSSELPGTAP